MKNQFTEEEIKSAKATRDLVIREGTTEMKSLYMAGEICMHQELKESAPALTEEELIKFLKKFHREVGLYHPHHYFENKAKELSLLLSNSREGKDGEGNKCGNCKFWDVLMVRESYGRYGHCRNKSTKAQILEQRSGHIEWRPKEELFVSKNFGCNQFCPSAPKTQKGDSK